MSELKIIPVTMKKYNELVDNGEINETALYEEKTFNLRWLCVGREKILQQLVIKKYLDHYEDEWRDIEKEELKQYD